MQPAPAVLTKGSKITDRYEIESVLGRGAFGTTYLARDLFHRMRVVVKVFFEDRAEVREAVRTEAEIAKALDHPNLRAVLDRGETFGKPFIVYEWIAGAGLDSVLSAGPLREGQAVAAARGIAGALRAAHALGLIHRDLKPANVVVPGWPETPDFAAVRLLDFSVAGVLEGPAEATRIGAIFGTPLYMSPEQVLGEPQTTATDVYALGLLLYEMLTGRKFREQTGTTDLLRSILHDPVPPMPPSIPPHLASLISECLRKDPASRPGLERVTQVLSFSATNAFAPMPAPQTAPPPPRRPVFVALSIVLAICAAILLGVLLLVRTPHPSPVFPAVFGGAFLIVLGSGAGFWIRGRLNRSSSELKTQALGLALDAKDRIDLTATIALQVTDLVGRLRQVDERILAGTVALMLNEYQNSTEGKDRQSALMNVVALSEKLGQRLSPWYVRYKDAIAACVALAGALSGLLTAYNGLRHK